MFQNQEVDSGKMTNLDAVKKTVALFAIALVMATTLSLAHARPAGAEDRALSFAVSGVVNEVLVKAGDAVKTGQALARLDARPFEAHVAAAEAEAAAAELSASVADENLARTQALYDDVSASGENLEVAKTAAAEAEARRAKAEARLAMASWRLEHATLQAPVDATVTAVPGHVGQVTNPRGVNPAVVVLDFP